jgi:hypothetical protein
MELSAPVQCGVLLDIRNRASPVRIPQALEREPMAEGSRGGGKSPTTFTGKASNAATDKGKQMGQAVC